MFGIKTAQNIIKEGKEFIQYRNQQRLNIDELADLISKQGSGQTHFFNPQPTYVFNGEASPVGLTDRSISAQDMWEMFERDTYVSGLYDQFINSLFKNNWFFQGSKGLANQYKAKLKEQKIDYLIKRRIAAKWADGGGNGLSYVVKSKKGLEVRVDPFFVQGQPRVCLYANSSIEKITKYEVIKPNTQSVIYSFDADDSYIEHFRYSERGDFRFSSNPAKKAVFWYILKKYISGTQLSSYQNGMQEPTILSLDYTGLAQLAQAFAQDTMKVGGDADTFTKKFISDPVKFFKDQSDLTREILMSELTGPANANKAILTKIPVTVTKVGRNNQNMQTIPLLQVCNEEMGYALRMSKGLLNTKDSKYSNAEQETDNFQNLVLDPEKLEIENWVMDWVMPIFFPSYNRETHPFRFSRDPDAEDLESFSLATERMKAQAEVIQKLNNTGYKYDLTKGEIIEAPQLKVEDPTTQNASGVGDKKQKTEGEKNVEDNVDNTPITEKKKRSFLDDAIDSKDAKKFEDIIRKATEDQFNFYIKKLEKRSDIQEAIDNIDSDLPGLTSSGLPVTTLRDQLKKMSKAGVDEYYNSTRAIREENYEYPQTLTDVFDAKSQLLLKGFDSLSENQRNIIDQFWNQKQYDGYVGLDSTASSEINTILNKNLKAGTGIDQAIKDIEAILPDFAEWRALRIAKTESAQAIEVARYFLYTENGYNEKSRVTVGDDRVRKTHLDDADEGWIKINDRFKASGELSPHEAINCRCNLRYRKSDKE